MKRISRRSFVCGSLAATAGTGWLSPTAWADVGPELEVIGKVRPRPSAQIAASPLGVGFETLDRKMFEPEPVYPFLAELGAKWARVQTGWCRCEPAQGKYDFAWLDAIVKPPAGDGDPALVQSGLRQPVVHTRSHQSIRRRLGSALGR